MLRNLQGNFGMVDAQYKAAVALKRGMAVAKKHADKTAILPTDGATEVYLVDRGLVNDPMLDVTGTLSDYQTILEDIAQNEYVGLIALVKGQRWATDQYTGVASDFDADKYVKVTTTGKFVACATDTPFKSIGLITDNGHTLLGFEIV